MLNIENIGKNFGGVKAVDDLTFRVDKGEIVGLIGPNGSGKSTTINLICGVFPVDLGSISVDDQNISKLPTHERVASGISRTFQNIRLFKDLSVWQNADLRQRILDLKKLGLTVLLVEHVMELVMNVVDRIVVLNFGKKIAEGSPENIQNNEDVQKAYLGGA